MPNFDTWLSTEAYPSHIDRTAEATRRLLKAKSIAESTMADTGVIWRNTSVSDGMGGTTETPAIVATLPCRLMLRTMQPSDRQAGGRLEVASDFVIRFRAGTDVRNADRIVITSAGSVTPRTFEVVKALVYTDNPSVSVAVVEVS